MKNLKSILFVILAGVFVLQSCQQETFEANEAQTEVQAEKRIWGLIIGAVVTIVIHLSEGQWQGTTNGDDNGCSGIGNCGNHMVNPGNGQGAGSTHNPDYVGDFKSFAKIAINENTGNVVLAMDQDADPEAKAKFFYADQIYMSPTQIIDSEDILQELGLSEPVVIEEGYYEVYSDEETQYINLQ